VVAEHDSESSFYPDAELTLFLRMRSKKSSKQRKCIPTEE